ncbi:MULTISPECIES: hypothetical protein [unclassified Streptomyces]|uniref:hypothetical protein n=1 Tax=unclassified Streptomyces TaxID=2593676 RepID=UPI003429C267
MPATARSGSTVARVVLERLLRPIWNCLVVYGAMWLPADQNPLWQAYRNDGQPLAWPMAPAPPEVPVTHLTSVARHGASDVNESGRTTLSAS